MTVTNITYMPNTEKHSGVSGIPTQLLVVHSGECPLRSGFAQSLTQWGNIPESQGGPQASWHWFTDPTTIVSMVDPVLTAWHASEANPMSEGFEQAGYARFSRDEWLTDDGRRSIDNLAWILSQRMQANGIPHRWLTNDEVTAVTTYGNRSLRGLCTHRQIDPETRYDPGDNFPYDYLDERIAHHLGTNTEEDDLDAEAKSWIKETRDRVIGRDEQRYFNPNTNEVRMEPFEGAIPARSTDVHDVLALHQLIYATTNQVLDAVRTIPGVDSSLIDDLGEKLTARLDESVKGIRVTLAPVAEEASE